jgi:hypothetical protein
LGDVDGLRKELYSAAIDGYTYGIPGGTTRGTVNVTNGALLSTDRATIGPNHWSTAATGQERNIAEVNVSGADSRWVVTGGNVVDFVTGAVSEGGAFVGTANHRNALAIVNITNGGVMEIQGPQGYIFGSGLNLTQGGGRTDMMVSGIGSKLAFTGDATILQIGRRIGSALLSILNGGSVTGMNYVSVGRDAAFGELVLDGADSLLSATGTYSAADGWAGCGHCRRSAIHHPVHRRRRIDSARRQRVRHRFRRRFRNQVDRL